MVNYIAILLIVIASIFRGGNRHIPLTMMEWLSLLMLSILIWKNAASLKADTDSNSLTPTKWLLIFLACSPLWIGLLQLSPLSLTSAGGEMGFGSWLGLDDLAKATGQTSVALKQATNPVWASLLAGAPIAACFSLALLAPKNQIKTIARLWIGLALVQSVLALLQTTGAKFLYFGADQISGAMGTFGNRNHLANFIVMTLPWVILELRSPASRHRANSRKPWIWGAVMFVLIAALMATQSRMGIASGLVVFSGALLVLSPQKKTAKLPKLWAGLIVVAIVLLALFSGGWDWLNRFDSDYLEKSAEFRENLRHLTWNAAMAYWPLGSGLGSFPLVFPEFQNGESTGFVNYAHNDYLQLLLELGVVFVLLLLLLLGMAGYRVRGLMRSARASSSGWSQANFFAAASGLGAMAIAMHAWVDFPLRIPVNAMLGAFLLGAFLRIPTEARHTGEKSSQKLQSVDGSHA